MRITRFLLPGFVVALGVGPALAQPQPRGGAWSDSPDFVPNVRPVGAEEPGLPGPPMPPGRPPAAVTSLEQMNVPPGYGRGDPVGTLTGQPTQPGPGGLPPGSYSSPYYTDGPGCCGPLGRDGRIGYDVYSYAGLNFTIGNGLPDLLKTPGWTVGGGVRTLFFNPTHTAAWTVDLGGSYTYNRGQGENEPTNLFLRSQPVQNQQNGGFQVQPDRFVLTAVRGVSRSSFNYAFGRDVWLLGDGSTGGQNGTNWRIGGWVGGRYGTSHVDMVPLDETNGYSRRQNVYHGIFVGAHTTFDVPMGSWIWTNGIRVEYGYDWTNLVPPVQGNLHNINLQFTTGIRY
ncbi:hypothetical protein J8F10_03310 [Gemmata sp. G18]|uniref:Outer membrane protein beta-barrel domain-containing protein n=1 Tax=Gemmata palustris TaxID=2822762 RepID=A0ABS5BKT7_9BACT|nr:hypothetical protein [Gemmata palustris]MBP3954324.1 hypothetical protein [Gemmata palustris]